MFACSHTLFPLAKSPRRRPTPSALTRTGVTSKSATVTDEISFSVYVCFISVGLILNSSYLYGDDRPELALQSRRLSCFDQLLWKFFLLPQPLLSLGSRVREPILFIMSSCSRSRALTRSIVSSAWIVSFSDSSSESRKLFWLDVVAEDTIDRVNALL